MNVKPIGSEAEVIIGGMKQVDYAPKNVTPTTIKSVELSTAFSYDNDANVFVTKMINPETKEVVRQYPPESMLEIAKELGKLQGNVVDEKV